MTNERKRPVAGIGFGQQGYHGNRHFSTFELARAAYLKYIEECKQIYQKSLMGFEIEQIPIVTGSILLEGVRLINVKKNGKRGKIIHTVHLYPIEAHIADMYIADPFYSVEA